MALVAGVDCSTQSTKVLVIDDETGRVVSSGHAPHEVRGSDGARESDPESFWSALRVAAADTGRMAEVSAIAVAGQQHGLVLLDGEGRPVRDAVLWNDVRSADDAENLVAQVGAEWWAEVVGSVPVAAFTVTSWAWLRRTEPAALQVVRAVRLPHDFVTERLCGRGVTDRGDASGTGWWSPSRGSYATDVLELPLVGLDPALLPEVLAAATPAGTVTARAAAELSLRAGTVVAAGTGDNMAAAVGLGVQPGHPVVSLGTSGTAYAVSTAATADATGVLAGFADAERRFLPLGCTLNATLAVDRFASWLHLDREDVAPSGQVVALPYLDGERTPNLPHASGGIEGLRHDTDPRSILMAAYEGAAASLVDVLDRLAAAGSGLDPEAPVVLIGGGAQGRAWREVVGRLSGRAIVVPQAQELVAMGAAALAAAALRGESPAAVAQRWGTLHGPAFEAPPRDEETLARIRAARPT